MHLYIGNQYFTFSHMVEGIKKETMLIFLHVLKSITAYAQVKY